jgi:hypothetical protein
MEQKSAQKESFKRGDLLKKGKQLSQQTLISTNESLSQKSTAAQ